MVQLTHPSRTLALGFAALLCLIVLSGWLVSIPTFEPTLATGKLALGLLHLGGIGFATHRLLALDPPRHLAFISYLLLGEVVAVGYVYFRSLLCDWTGIPGVSFVEIGALEAYLGARILVSGPREPSTKGAGRAVWVEWTLLGLVFAWLVFIAHQKLGLFHTPSSDPDTHAFFARRMLAEGRIFYDLLPDSDVAYSYPSGFASLNFVLGRLSGLHPVQLVNISPYLQVVLFAALTLTVVARSIRRSSLLIMAAIGSLAIQILCFNPVFVLDRPFLEGTPRLAHTALLFFPLFFVIQNTRTAIGRPSISAIPAIAVAVGCCINPAHAPASLLMGCIATLVLVLGARSSDETMPARLPRLLRFGGAILVPFAIVLFADPFYRSLGGQEFVADATSVVAAEELTGSAFGWSPDERDPDTREIRSVWTLAPNAPAIGARGVGVCAMGLLGLHFITASRRRRIPALRTIPDERALHLFGLGAFNFVLIHGLWTQIVPHLVRTDVLQGVLLTRYTESLQEQGLISFLGIAIAICLAFAMGHLEQLFDNSSLLRRSPVRISLALGTSLLFLSIPPLLRVGITVETTFYPKLQSSPLGTFDAAEVEFIEDVAERIPSDERVLLPGRHFRSATEHWIFPTHASRALPLYTSARTAFFLGLDGRAFTPDAYVAHVHRRIDHEWLRLHRVIWLIDTGELPTRKLRRHYEKISTSERLNLWRLRD